MFGSLLSSTVDESLEELESCPTRKKLTFQLFSLFHPTAKFYFWPIGYFEEINRLASYEAGIKKIYYGVNLIVSL